MFTPKSVIEGKSIDNVNEDFKAAKKVEQYKIGKKALYIPRGLNWDYIPKSEITGADESHRVISGGHCVPIRESRPDLNITTTSGTFKLSLEKSESMHKILDDLINNKKY